METIHLLAMRTGGTVCAARDRGALSDARADELNRWLASLASQLDRGEINATEYTSDVTAIAAGLPA
jgi:hypothetical protein